MFFLYKYDRNCYAVYMYPFISDSPKMTLSTVMVDMLKEQCHF
jgi:hypothetical protein